VIGHGCDPVRRTFAALDSEVVWVEQKRQLGTAHAVTVCGEYLDKLEGAVLVVAGDGPLIRAETLRQLVRTHQASRAACTLATCILDDPGRYGRIVRNQQGDLVGIVEYLDADEDQRRINEVNVSLYCFDAAALRRVLPRLGNRNAKSEYYLTDVVGLMRQEGAELAAVPAVWPQDVLSINTLEELQKVSLIMAARTTPAGARP